MAKKIKKIKKNYLLKIMKAMGRKLRGLNVVYAKEHPRDKDIDLLNANKEYLHTIDPNILGLSFKQITEQNEEGIGRPKVKIFTMKKNRTKFTIREQDETVWNFIPYMGFAQIKEFLNNIEARCDITETVSKLLRNEVVIFGIPENRIPYLKSIYINGSSANPYYKEEKENDSKYLVEKFNKNWNI